MSQLKLSSVEAIKELARKHGVHPSSLSGQHFLVDEKILAKIVELSEIKPHDVILEIGPGFGVLTAELLEAAKRVIAVERDKHLAAYLQERFKGCSNLELLNKDILKFKPASVPYRLIANIPYQITGKIIRKFVGEEIHKPKDMLVMVQKEVGERVCAKPGKMNLLAIWTQLYGEPSMVLDAPRECFWPVPKVDSVVLSIKGIKPEPRYPIRDFLKFWRILRIGFSSPRKQVHNNLAAGLHLRAEDLNKELSKVGISGQARAQELSIEDWIKIAGSF